MTAFIVWAVTSALFMFAGWVLRGQADEAEPRKTDADLIDINEALARSKRRAK